MTARARLERALAGASPAALVQVYAGDLRELLDELENIGQVHTGGRPPYGWRAHRGALLPVLAEQNALRQVAAHRAAGQSWRQVAAALTALGIRTRGGQEWTSAGIHRAFTNAQKRNPLITAGGETDHNRSVTPVTSETQESRVTSAL